MVLSFLCSCFTTGYFRVPGASLVCDSLERVPPHDSVQYSLLGQVVVLSHHDHRLELLLRSSCTATPVPTFRQMVRNPPVYQRIVVSLSLPEHARRCFVPPKIPSTSCPRHFRLPITGCSPVPYIDFTSYPHRCSSPGSVLSSSHNFTSVSLAARACMYARLMSWNINTLGFFPVTVADSSIREASSGGVAANKTWALPVLICFATSLGLTFMSCLSPFFVVDPLHVDGWLLGLLKTILDGSLLVHIHLLVPFHLQCTCFPHLSMVRFLTVDVIPRFCQLLLCSPPQVEHTSSNSSWMSLLVTSSSRKQLTIMPSCLFASSCFPSSSAFLYVLLTSSLGWFMFLIRLLILFCLFTSLSASLHLGPSSFSISTSFRLCSDSACLSAGSSSTLFATACSRCRSCLCCSFFNPSRPSSSCSMLVLILSLHSLLCGVESTFCSPCASWALLCGTLFSDMRSGYVHYPRCLVQCGYGCARVTPLALLCWYVLIFSNFRAAPRSVGLDWYVVSSSTWHGVGSYSSNVQHVFSTPSLILWNPSDGLRFHLSARRPDD